MIILNKVNNKGSLVSGDNNDYDGYHSIKMYVTREQMDEYIRARLDDESKEQFKDAWFVPTNAVLCMDGSLEVTFITAI